MSIPTLEEETKAANEMISSLNQADDLQQAESLLREPPSTEVFLPGGFYDFDGEVSRTAIVRELTGRDEEAIGREARKAADNKSYGKILVALLDRGVVQIGDEENTSEALDMIYMADWDALLLGVYTVTFGEDIQWTFLCPNCAEVSQSSINLNTDVDVKGLDSENRVFMVQGRRTEYKVALPTGETARKALITDFKSAADFNTCLLSGSLMEIGGTPVMGEEQVRDMPLGDRRKIQAEIQDRTPVVKLEAVRTTCTACEEEVDIPIPLAALFRSQGMGL